MILEFPIEFLMSFPECTLVGLGEGLRLFLSLSSLLGGLDLEPEHCLLSCLQGEGLGEPEELLERGLPEGQRGGAAGCRGGARATT